MSKIFYFLLTKSFGLYLNFLVYIFTKKAQKLSYTLFSSPRAGKFKDNKLPKFLQVAVADKFTYLDYSVQTYVWQGNDEVILLIHGWESNTSRWKKALPHLLSLGKTIVAIDAPAHGLTSGTEFNVPIYAEIIQLAIEKFKPDYLIGHSIGGAALVYNQYKYPNANIKKQILLGTPDEVIIIFRNYFKLLSLNNKNQKLFLNYFEVKYNIDITTFSGTTFAKNNKTETLIIHDQTDAIVLFEEGKKLEKAFEFGTFVQTNLLGHSLHSDQVYQKIVSFLQY